MKKRGQSPAHLAALPEEELLALEAHEAMSRERRLRDQFRHLRELERQLGRKVEVHPADRGFQHEAARRRLSVTDARTYGRFR